MFNAAFLFISRRVLGKLPVLLVHLFWHQSVDRNANPTTLSAKDGKPFLPFFKVFGMDRPGIEPAIRRNTYEYRERLKV